MILGRKGNLLVVGLERGNVEKLIDDQPILKDLVDFDMPGVGLLVVFGEDEHVLLKKLIDLGLFTEETDYRDERSNTGNA